MHAPDIGRLYPGGRNTHAARRARAGALVVKASMENPKKKKKKKKRPQHKGRDGRITYQVSASPNPSKPSDNEFAALCTWMKAVGTVDRTMQFWPCEERGYQDCLLFTTALPWPALRELCAAHGTPTMLETLGDANAPRPECVWHCTHQDEVICTQTTPQPPASIPPKFWRHESDSYVLGQIFLDAQEDGHYRCISDQHDGEMCSMATYGKCVWKQTLTLPPERYAEIQHLAVTMQ